MRCPSCGNRGKPESRAKAGEPAAFEFRGRLGAKVVVRCLQCDRGVFVRMVPPGSKAIPPDQWDALDRFWQMRRAEILADLQAFVEHGGGEDWPEEEVIQESQTSFIGSTQRAANFLISAQQAGYEAENLKDLMRNDPAEFARIALTARQQNVIHDGYEELLAHGGVPQTGRAAQRIAAAKEALAGGEESVRTFLSEGAARYSEP